MSIRRFFVFSWCLLLCSCIELHLGLKLNEDGSVEIHKKIGIAREYLKTPFPQNLVKDSVEWLKEGFQIHPYRDSAFAGLEGDLKLQDPSNLASVLNLKGESFQSNTDANGQSVPPLQVIHGPFYDTYVLNTNLDLRRFRTSAMIQRTVVGTADVELSLELPSACQSSNATIQSADGKTLRWKIHLTDNNPIKAVVRVWNWIHLSLGLLALILLGIFAWWIAQYRRRSQQS